MSSLPSQAWKLKAHGGGWRLQMQGAPIAVDLQVPTERAHEQGICVRGSIAILPPDTRTAPGGAHALLADLREWRLRQGGTDWARVREVAKTQAQPRRWHCYECTFSQMLGLPITCWKLWL
jgi:hypothetical protein